MIVRIATTISGYSNNQDTSTNNLYVLDDDLDIIGKLEGVAPGESIYSVRFIGDRGYMVTFRHIDPLFVIDLSDPRNPKIYEKMLSKFENISLDFKHPGEDHVSYITYDTENQKVYSHVISRGMNPFIKKIKELLLLKHE